MGDIGLSAYLLVGGALKRGKSELRCKGRGMGLRGEDGEWVFVKFMLVKDEIV